LACGGFIAGTVEHLSAGGIDLLAEKETGGMLHLFEKHKILITEEPRVGRLSCGSGLHLSE
jgi:hypothetical protein